ncbi:carbonic anhydrase family protein [uncultured Thalassospira sp.]|uniref:carbonic anhydrase n=1 Tax=uncultured Thalassospira sp. TaxID=404382 RepID=UPI0030DA5D34|tara:strand:+ start:3958 stop:4713 length:756 start_codon:yes stop_codon:yes gene_type:complete
MKKSLLSASMMAIALAFTWQNTGHAEEKHAHWSYEGATGPSYWSSLDPAYQLCGTGRNQSPINLASMISSKLAPVNFQYQTGATTITNNGHTVQITAETGSYIALNGHGFALRQMHFHAPSENQIDGKSFALEGHMVHADINNNLAVVAVMYEIGAPNAALGEIWGLLPEHAGETTTAPASFKWSSILTDNHDYYRFNGSLTTPPCDEGVTWLVLKQPQTISAEQLTAFTHTQHGDNNRPVQQIFARPVLQ